MARKLECRHCGTFNSAGDFCRCMTSNKPSAINIGILKSEILKSIYLIESGNDYQGILQLKGIALALEIATNSSSPDHRSGNNEDRQMADISMCVNSECPSFNRCYRAQATVNEYIQSYTAFDPKGESQCEDFVPLNEDR